MMVAHHQQWHDFPMLSSRVSCSAPAFMLIAILNLIINCHMTRATPLDHSNSRSTIPSSGLEYFHETETRGDSVIHKHMYFHAPDPSDIYPEEMAAHERAFTASSADQWLQHGGSATPRSTEAERHYKIIFIKAPTPPPPLTTPPPPPPPPPPAPPKTLVYVMLPQQPKNQVTPVPTTTTTTPAPEEPPQVYFLKYEGDGEDAMASLPLGEQLLTTDHDVEGVHKLLLSKFRGKASIHSHQGGLSNHNLQPSTGPSIHSRHHPNHQPSRGHDFGIREFVKEETDFLMRQDGPTAVEYLNAFGPPHSSLMNAFHDSSSADGSSPPAVLATDHQDNKYLVTNWPRFHHSTTTAAPRLTSLSSNLGGIPTTTSRPFNSVAKPSIESHGTRTSDLKKKFNSLHGMMTSKKILDPLVMRATTFSPAAGLPRFQTFKHPFHSRVNTIKEPSPSSMAGKLGMATLLQRLTQLKHDSEGQQEVQRLKDSRKRPMTGNQPRQHEDDTINAVDNEEPKHQVFSDPKEIFRKVERSADVSTAKVSPEPETLAYQSVNDKERSKNVADKLSRIQKKDVATSSHEGFFKAPRFSLD